MDQINFIKTNVLAKLTKKLFPNNYNVVTWSGSQQTVIPLTQEVRSKTYNICCN